MASSSDPNLSEVNDSAQTVQVPTPATEVSTQSTQEEVALVPFEKKPEPEVEKPKPIEEEGEPAKSTELEPGFRKGKNHYETLGVSTTASTEEIKKAYRVLALQHHPDKYMLRAGYGAANATEKQTERYKAAFSVANDGFKLIDEAYQTLSDPNSKELYDYAQEEAKRKAFQGPQQASQGPQQASQGPQQASQGPQQASQGPQQAFQRPQQAFRESPDSTAQSQMPNPSRGRERGIARNPHANITQAQISYDHLLTIQPDTPIVPYSPVAKQETVERIKGALGKNYKVEALNDSTWQATNGDEKIVFKNDGSASTNKITEDGIKAMLDHFQATSGSDASPTFKLNTKGLSPEALKTQIDTIKDVCDTKGVSFKITDLDNKSLLEESPSVNYRH